MFRKTPERGNNTFLYNTFIIDPLRLKLELQKSLLQRKIYDRPLNGVATTKITHSHSVSSYRLPKKPLLNANNFFPGTERNLKPIIQNNININVQNIYVNNDKIENYLNYSKDLQNIVSNPKQKVTNNIGLLKMKNLFTKIGNDIISKSQSMKKLPTNYPIKYRFRTPIQKYNNIALSQNGFISNVNNSAICVKRNSNMLMDVIEQNKDSVVGLLMNNNNNNNNNNSDNCNNSNTNNNNNDIEKSFIVKNNYRENQIKVNDITIQGNSKIWEMLFEMEIHIDNKIYLISTLNKLLFYLHTEFLGSKSNINLDIFIQSILSKQYKKLMKLSIVCLMYIKFLLNDFNFEMALKVAVKNLIYNFNDTLLLLTKQCVFIGDDSVKLSDNPKCSLIGNEFSNVYNKLIKIHKIRRNSETFNSFSLTLGKKIDGVITLLRQFTNNYFKIGYFKPIHIISIELFKQVESSTFEHIVRIIENHVLFYLMHCNLGGKNNSSNNNTTDQNSSTTQTSSGFHPNGTIPSSVPSFPYLPPIDRRKDIYTLVLDLDETLVHYFYVSQYIYIYTYLNYI